jgi:hypothetical protein
MLIEYIPDKPACPRVGKLFAWDTFGKAARSYFGEVENTCLNFELWRCDAIGVSRRKYIPYLIPLPELRLRMAIFGSTLLHEYWWKRRSKDNILVQAPTGTILCDIIWLRERIIHNGDMLSM